MFEPRWEDLDAEATLAFASEARAAADRAELMLLVAAAHFADLHGATAAEEADPARGRERVVWLGGEGTPGVAEFAPMELGAELGMSTGAAAAMIGEVLELRHRLPRLWSRVRSAEVPAWRARMVARATTTLTPRAAAAVDARVARIAESVTPYRLKRIIAAAVMAVDPERARAEAEEAAAQRGVWPSRSDRHGMRRLAVRADAPDVARFDASVDYVADLLAAAGDADAKQVLRAKALGWLANPRAVLDLAASVAAGAHGASEGPGDPHGASGGPGDAGRTGRTQPRPRHREVLATEVSGASQGAVPAFAHIPQVVLYVHLSDRTLITGDGAVRVRGMDPMLLDHLHRFLRGARVSVRPVIDLADRVSVDAYEVPARVRERVELQDPVCVFPWCNRPAEGCDMEHPVAYDPGGPPGQTCSEELAPVCRRHHRGKTHGRWSYRRLGNGAWAWTGPRGQLWLVDHTGTHRVDAPAGTAGHGRPSRSASSRAPSWRTSRRRVVSSPPTTPRSASGGFR